MMMSVSREDLEGVVAEVVARLLGQGIGQALIATPSREALAGAVRAEFARRGIHRKELAAVIGRSLPTAVGRMRGTHAFQPAEVEAVAAFLGMTVADLYALATHGDRFIAQASTAGGAARPVDLWEQPPRSRRQNRAH